MALATLCFGAIPATMLAFYALLGAYTALDGTPVEDGGLLTDAFLVLGFVLGCIGMLGMWIAVFRRDPVVWMLIAGLGAVVCGLVSLGLVGALSEIHPLFAGLFVLPAIVAAIHIGRARTAKNLQVRDS